MKALTFAIGFILISASLQASGKEVSNNTSQCREKELPDHYIATYFGGDSNETCWGIALDEEGYVYVTGYTLSSDFPSDSESRYRASKGKGDAYVLKFDKDFKRIIASARLGGSGDDIGYSILCDKEGFIYIAGYTDSRDFPVTDSAFCKTFNGGEGDAFLLKMDRELKSIVASTYLGGSGDENDWYSPEMILDESGNIYIAGNTSSADFPTTLNVLSPKYNGGKKDVFISKFDRDLKRLIASTFLGGIGTDKISRSFCIDKKKNELCIGGTTTSDNFPVSGNAYCKHINGKEIDSYILKLTPDLARITASTILPVGWIYSMFIHDNGNIYVGGHTTEGIPTTPNAYYRKVDMHFDQGFISGFDNELTTLKASTILPGVETPGTGGEIISLNLAQSNQGDIISAGWANAKDFPATPGAFDETPNGGTDLYILQMNKNLSEILVSTFVGGARNERWNRMAKDNKGNLYIASYTGSKDFPTTKNTAYDKFNGGGSDGFLIRMGKNLLSSVSEEFHDAAKKDDLKKVKNMIVKENILIEKTDRYTRTALHSAVRYGAAKVCRYLMESGANLNAKDESGHTPLHLSVLHNQDQMLKMLMDSGADINALNREGDTPLLLAGIYGSPQAADLLLSKNADLNSRDRKGNTLLHIASSRGKMDLVKTLLKYRPNIDEINYSGKTPLQLAVKKNDNGSIIELLLNHGANIRITDSTGKGLLHDAYSNIHLLIQKGSDINLQDNAGNTPLHSVLSDVIRFKEFFPPLQSKLKLLIDAGADPLIKNKDGKTALVLAEETRIKEVIELIKKTK